MTAIAIPRTLTPRILRTECLFCGVEIDLEIVGVIGDVQAWLDELELEAWEYFAEEHGCEVATSRRSMGVRWLPRGL